MKIAILISSVVALAVTTHASAEPGNNKDRGHSNHNHSAPHHSGDRPNDKSHRHDKNSVHHSERNGHFYALDRRGNCPPGLAKKNNGCLPPGQAKKQFDVGQRYNSSFGNVWNFNQIPVNLRSQYNLDASDRYFYHQGYLYRVDQRTSLVEQAISILLRQ